MEWPGWTLFFRFNAHFLYIASLGPSDHQFIEGFLAERLRRWTRNPLGNSRVGSNPAAVVNSFLALPVYTPCCRSVRMLLFVRRVVLNTALK